MNQLSDLARLFAASIHWIDVRAPVEFAAGAVPGAVNLPLLNDEERKKVGTVYKEEGQAAAIELGHRLVSGGVKEERLSAWVNEIKKNPEAVIYCFRGGLRSQTVQTWLRERGVDRPIVAGGYKAMRRFLMEAIESQSATLKFRVVSGPTGSGKTAYLRASGKPYLDLEAIARHRGSAFGATREAQPSQADFENKLALELLKLRGSAEVLVENESRLIGKCYLPETLHRAMKRSPVLELAVPLEQRIENILEEYIAAKGEEGAPRFDDFRASVKAITRKLGGQRAQEIIDDINAAEREFQRNGSIAGNRAWIEKILTWYYDPLYQFSTEREKS